MAPVGQHAERDGVVRAVVEQRRGNARRAEPRVVVQQQRERRAHAVDGEVHGGGLPFERSKRCTSQPSARHVGGAVRAAVVHDEDAARRQVIYEGPASVPGSTAAPLRHAITAVTCVGSLVNSARGSSRPRISITSFAKSTSAQNSTVNTIGSDHEPGRGVASSGTTPPSSSGATQARVTPRAAMLTAFRAVPTRSRPHSPHSEVFPVNREQRLAELRRRREEALAGGGPERIAKIHAKGRLTARERIELLLDSGSFVEMGLRHHRSNDFGMGDKRITGDGVVAGWGLVEGRLVYCFAQDFTVFGGTMSGANAKKICAIMDLAMDNGAPVVGLNDSGGARIRKACSRSAPTLTSSCATRSPRASCRRSPRSWDRARAAQCAPRDHRLHDHGQDTSHMFVTGPEVIKSVTAEDVSFGDLGGAMTHNTKSGVAHFAAADDADAIRHVKRLLSFVPGNNAEDAPRRVLHRSRGPSRAGTGDARARVARQALRHGELVRLVVDDGDFFEVHEHFAGNIVVGFAPERPARRHRRQPAARARRRARHRLVGEGRAIRALLRRVQHPARHVRGRARLPPRHAPGMGRHHPARREAALRLLRGDRAQS